MAKEELYKSGIVFLNPKDLRTKNCLEESQLDVLKTIPDAVKAAAACPKASTIKTPGITGWPGKWPCTKKLSFLT